MKKLIFVIALCACTLFIAGCNEQNPTKATLNGQWRLTNCADAGINNDDPGYPNFYLVIDDGGNWQWQTAQAADDIQTAFSGTYVVADDVMTFSSSTGCGKFTIAQLANDELVLNNASETGCDQGITGSQWSVVKFGK